MLLRLVETIHPKEERWLADCGHCGNTVLDPTQISETHLICPVCKTESPFQIVASDGIYGLMGGSFGNFTRHYLP